MHVLIINYKRIFFTNYKWIFQGEGKAALMTTKGQGNNFITPKGNCKSCGIVSMWALEQLPELLGVGATATVSEYHFHLLRAIGYSFCV